jgi:hypothetical protein
VLQEALLAGDGKRLELGVTLEGLHVDPGAVTTEALDRSLMLPPDALVPRPPTDGGHFHLSGVPLVNFPTAPFYLFDAMDTLEKIHQPSLVPITRAAIRMIHATRGVSAARCGRKAASPPYARPRRLAGEPLYSRREAGLRPTHGSA